MDLQRYLSEYARHIDIALNNFLPKAVTKPATIHRAMRYSLFAGGKRVRPILALAAAEACGGALDTALPAACAIECVHTYSLIHDDLPCMDNDDLRRGRPTSHKVFGEGIAVLAGDALLTQAFKILAQALPTRRYSISVMIRELSDAAGSLKLIAGQVADLEGEGKPATRAQLQFIHKRKTAAMLGASLRLGAMSANANPAKLEALTVFGLHLGLAFQIIDDILDVTQTTAKLGKSAGKDMVSKKTTYPSVIGLESSRKEARKLTETAMNALKLFKSRGLTLRALAEHLLVRDY